MSVEPASPQPLLGTLDYLAEVAKDWAQSRFAAAGRSDFVLTPHRFELRGTGVRRRRVSAGSPEAESPLACAPTARPTAWGRAAISLVVNDTETGAIVHEQEIVEVLVLDGDELLAEAAFVVRAPGLPPCLGRFRPIS